MTIRHGSPSRALDWGCALLILSWGITLLLPGDTFLLTPAYEGLLARGSEAMWGTICVVVGAVHAAALVINGRLYEGMPIVRAVAAVMGMFVWGQFAMAFIEVSLSVRVLSLGVASAGVAALLNLYCAARAGWDAIHGGRARGVRS